MSAGWWSRPQVEEILGGLIGSTREDHGHGPECEAYRHTTRSLARILRALLDRHPAKPHGCATNTCPRLAITEEIARRWRPL